MACRGLCGRYRARRTRWSRAGDGRYADGQKRCQVCEVFIKWDGNSCPCCSYRLRSKPRAGRHKAVYEAAVRARAAASGPLPRHHV